MSGMPIKAIGIWLVFVISAILNGVFREKVLVPAIGTSIALPLSGVILAALVFLVTLMSVDRKIFLGSESMGWNLDYSLNKKST